MKQFKIKIVMRPGSRISAGKPVEVVVQPSAGALDLGKSLLTKARRVAVAQVRPRPMKRLGV